MELARGTRLLDRYVLEERIGGGGMATIMTARDERTGKLVAVKQMTMLGDMDGDRQRAWFKREIKAMMVLDHPGVPRLLDHGPLDDEAPYIVIEYLRGFDLEQAVSSHGPMPEGAVVLMTVKLLAALDAAHGLSIVHRDIKPSNMFLCFSGRALLLDFGLARATSQFYGETLARGNATALAGTPQYFSPEQVTGETKLSPQSDLFSLGASLYHVLSGRGPFYGGSVLDTLSAIRENARRPLASTGHWLHPRTVAFVEHLLAYAPNDRPHSASAALTEAEALLPLFPDAETTLRKYATAIERNEPPPGPQVGGTQEVAVLPTPPVTPAVQESATANATVIATVMATGMQPHTVVSTMPSTSPASKTNRTPKRALVAAGVLATVGLGVAWFWVKSERRPTAADSESAPLSAPLPAPAAAPLPEPVAPPTAQEKLPEPPQEPPPTAGEPKRAATGTLVLRLHQWAEVFIDGRSLGRKQIMATMPLSEGPHTLELRNDRYGTQKRNLNIKRNQETEMAIDFTDPPR